MPDKAAIKSRGFRDVAALKRWFSQQHARATELWLEIGKKGADAPSVSYAEALDVALCFGWIDGHKRPLDEKAWLQRLTPRGPKSRWSKINCGKALALIESKRMQEPGLAEIERAKADGRWDAAYASPKNAQVPEDFVEALARNPKAAAFFAEIDRANRYAILYRIGAVKLAATRQRKIAEMVSMLARGEKIHGPRRRKA